MSIYSIFRHKNRALLMALSAAYPVIGYSAGAAHIDFATGAVTAVNSAGAQRPLVKGAEISNGDTIRTGEGGRAQVRFSDGALISLQPTTEFRIDSYEFSKQPTGQEKGFFSLLKGGMRTITGLIGRSNRDNYKVTTSVATIGIRGTEYTAGFNAGGDELLVHTGEGLVEVCNSTGCVLLAAGESGSVQGKNAKPTRTDTRPQLPPAQPPPDVMPVFSTGDIIGGLLVPTSPMPTTGSATYTQIYSQAPGTTAQLTSVNMSVNFASPSVSATLNGLYGGSQNFSAVYTGSFTGNKLSSVNLDAFSTTGSFCSSCCTSGNVTGTFFGATASQVGINYSVSNMSSQTASGSAVLK